jgi:hypothetical protein
MEKYVDCGITTKGCYVEQDINMNMSINSCNIDDRRQGIKNNEIR